MKFKLLDNEDTVFVSLSEMMMCVEEGTRCIEIVLGGIEVGCLCDGELQLYEIDTPEANYLRDKGILLNKSENDYVLQVTKSLPWSE